MYTNKEWIFKEILDCGLADLDMLDNMEDFDLDIIETLKENGTLSLAGIFRETFSRAKDDAAANIKSHINDILKWLEDHKTEVIKLLYANEDEYEKVVSSNMLFANLSDQTENDMLNFLAERYCENKKSAEEEYSDVVLAFKALDPSNDFDLEFNYQASFLYIANSRKKDLYFAFFGEELSEIENKMGLYFSGR